MEQLPGDLSLQKGKLQEKFEHEHHIETEPRRWIILLGYSLLIFSNFTCWSTYSLIIDKTEKYYGIGETAYLQFFNVFIYGLLITLILCGYFMTDHFATCLMISSILTSIGGIMRYAAGSNYKIAIIGQFLIALAEGSLMSAPAVISERWFSSHEGIWALLIGTYSLYLGWIFGNVSPCYYLAKYPDLDRFFGRMYFDQMILTILPTVILAVSIKNKPTHSPNVGALIKAAIPTQSLGKMFKSLLSDGVFMRNTICIGYALGVSYTLTSVTSYIVTPRDYSINQLGHIATAYLAPGIMIAIAGTLYLEIKKSKDYDFMLKIFFTLGMAGSVGLAAAGVNADFWLVLLLNALIGLGYISFVPFALESLIETSFPHPEGFALALPIIASQIISFLLNELATMSAIGYQGYWILAGSAFPATIYVLFGYKTNFKRTRSELEREKNEVEQEDQYPILNFTDQKQDQVL